VGTGARNGGLGGLAQGLVGWLDLWVQVMYSTHTHTHIYIFLFILHLGAATIFRALSSIPRRSDRAALPIDADQPCPRPTHSDRLEPL
jgi:hypothetical protein